MNDDHLAAIANQKNGTVALLQMVQEGEVTAEKAVAILRQAELRRFSEMNLAEKLAHWFSRVMFYLARYPNL